MAGKAKSYDPVVCQRSVKEGYRNVKEGYRNVNAGLGIAIDVGGEFCWT
ncbi:hypothetical protein [Dyadobacter linearis]|nr:hypothetical protein [Dyadobacter sp. CECT 9623]